MRFSEHFCLRFQQPELDFVDIDPDRDTRLFLDPYAFACRSDSWSVKCSNSIVSFFQTAVDCIRRGEHRKARALLSNLTEPNDTCLGLSSGHPRGRGVSGKQALDLYEKLAESSAVRTGLLTELSDCELMVNGVSHDKISDITTNIIRGHLIEYTQDQCDLHQIRLTGEVASGRYWDDARQEWTQRHVRLPVINGRRVVLVPKASVRLVMSLDHQEYYQHDVLNFLQQEHLEQGSSLVRVLRSGERRVYKKDLKQVYECSKEFLFEFSKKHPEVLQAYKRSKAARAAEPESAVDCEEISEETIAHGILQRLRELPPGNASASAYHQLMTGALEFIFYPQMIYPVKEMEIHEGRKRIDITYTNNAVSGFFYRSRTDPVIASRFVMVECKNYSGDPKNPELDQLAGRFSPTRGWLGLLVVRTLEDRDLFMARCRDTARDRRGFIIPFSDDDIAALLGFISRGARRSIDSYVEHTFRAICS